MGDWKKGDRCAARRTLRLRVPGWNRGSVGLANVRVEKGTKGTVHATAGADLLVAWELTSTEDPDAAMRMHQPISTPAIDCEAL